MFKTMIRIIPSGLLYQHYMQLIWVLTDVHHIKLTILVMILSHWKWFVLNFENMSFPLPTSNIKDFKMKNPHISVNVYGLNDDNAIVGPYYSTINEKAKHINLLLLKDGQRFHYVWIKYISKDISYSLFLLKKANINIKLFHFLFN